MGRRLDLRQTGQPPGPGMEDIVKAEYDRVAKAEMAMRNAFSYFDGPSDAGWSADTWSAAHVAAQNLADEAEALADAAWKIARQREEAVPDDD